MNVEICWENYEFKLIPRICVVIDCTRIIAPWITTVRNSAKNRLENVVTYWNYWDVSHMNATYMKAAFVLAMTMIYVKVSYIIIKTSSPHSKNTLSSWLIIIKKAVNWVGFGSKRVWSHWRHYHNIRWKKQRKHYNISDWITGSEFEIRIGYLRKIRRGSVKGVSSITKPSFMDSKDLNNKRGAKYSITYLYVMQKEPSIL
jgi:hypothetical protein